MAGSVVLVAPVVVLLVALQRQFTQAIAMDGRRRSGPCLRASRGGPAGWAFSAPFVAIFSVFMLMPMLGHIGPELHRLLAARTCRTWTSAPFVGLDNFARLFEDPAFRKALRNTAYFTVVGVPCTVGARAGRWRWRLNQTLGRLRSVLRVGFYLPVVTSIVAVAVAWRYLLDPDVGLVNAGLARVGIDGTGLARRVGHDDAVDHRAGRVAQRAARRW